MTPSKGHFRPVEIKDQTIRLFQMIDGRSPRVDFDNADCTRHMSPASPSIATIALCLRYRSDGRWHPTLATDAWQKSTCLLCRGASQQTQRTASDMREIQLAMPV